MLLLASCAPRPCAPEAPADSSADSSAPAEHFVLRGGVVVGLGPADVEVADGRIVAVGVTGGAEIVDVSGRWLVPAFIDSHVHLAYFPEGEALAAGGVAGAVDLAAPLAFLSADHGSLAVMASGPMVTAVGGYPTAGWGRDGYGLECADAEAAADAVDRLADAGATVIKLPITTEPVLDVEALSAAAGRAHTRGLRVASHAVRDAEAAAAAAVGVDVLAHTPVEALSPSTIAAWSGGAVISTLQAFGAAPATVANLTALRAAGATVLYGTDFGNTRTTGIDGAELQALVSAGLDGAAILAAGTSTPATYWGFADLGAIAPGKAASLLVLDADPLVDPLTLARPEQVYINGRQAFAASSR